jgi:uncharacterized protein (TIRG00374 family)
VKFWLNLLASLAVGAVCVWAAWPRHDQLAEIKHAFVTLRWGWVALYVATLVGVHFFRAWRWDFLLRPSGVRVPLGRLLAVSSVGFMAILALPARLGEFVRPYLIAERGRLTMSEALGTVAVERIIDGLMISFLVFFSFLSLSGPGAPAWMMPAAYGSLGLFVAATIFLIVGVIAPERTARIAVRIALLDRFAPGLARRIEHMLVMLCRGFRVLGDVRNLAAFLLGTALYWGFNGFGMWILARGFDLPLSLVGAFATMGLTGVGIMLPNSPGLIGQFHYFSQLGLLLYLPAALAKGPGVAYVAVLHGLQLVWYLGIGCLCLLSSHVSFARVVRASQTAAGAEAEAAREVAA